MEEINSYVLFANKPLYCFCNETSALYCDIVNTLDEFAPNDDSEDVCFVDILPNMVVALLE